jgi:hypothetical protein
MSFEDAAYWVARSRLRQGFDEATNPWHAEALAKAASRAMTVVDEAAASHFSRHDPPDRVRWLDLYTELLFR